MNNRQLNKEYTQMLDKKYKKTGLTDSEEDDDDEITSKCIFKLIIKIFFLTIYI